MISQKTDINQLQYENEELKARLAKLEKEIPKQKSFGPDPKPIDSCRKKVGDGASRKNEKPSSRALDLLPKPCEELRKEGHFANGIYPVHWNCVTSYFRYRSYLI